MSYQAVLIQDSEEKAIPGRHSRHCCFTSIKMRENFTVGGGNQDYTPRFLVCNLCSREFGTKSLIIHQKQCAAKQAKNPKQHLKQQQNNLASTNAPQLMRAYDSTLDGEMSIAQFNEMAMNDFNANMIERGTKVPCDSCGRTFNRVEGLEKHRKLCERGTKVFDRKWLTDGDDSSVRPRTSVSVRGHSVDSGAKKSFKPRPQTGAVPKVTPASRAVRVQISGDYAPQIVKSSISPSTVREIQPEAQVIISETANYCVDCGQNFTRYADSVKFKFCPCCGSRRA